VHLYQVRLGDQRQPGGISHDPRRALRALERAGDHGGDLASAQCRRERRRLADAQLAQGVVGPALDAVVPVVLRLGVTDEN
jgi:hypothetical protein